MVEMKYRYVAGIGLVLIVAGCHRRPVPTVANLSNGRSINTAMTDAEMLAAFDVDLSKAAKDFVQGKDGTSTTYKTDNEEVTITRSAFGVFIIASGKIRGDWNMHFPGDGK